MFRTARWLRRAALLVAVVGGACWYYVHRPLGLDGWLAALASTALGAVTDPWVLAAAALLVGATITGAIVGRLPATPPTRHDGRHRRLDEPSRINTDPGADLTPSLARWLRDERDVPRFVDELLAAAAAAGASDVHLQPLAEGVRVTLRVDGELYEAARLGNTRHDAIVRRLKILAGLVPYETARPQDGHFAAATPSGSIDLRLAVVPTRHGEKVVLRLARGGAEGRRLDELGMGEGVLATLRGVLVEPQGLVVLTGPTGSGKTTTLYSALADIHEHRGDRVNIASLEDPIEVELPFLNQTEIGVGGGPGFADVLRAVLRQDPNVLMVGEIRDAETAHIAVQAGLSGHLVLTSLHSDSSAAVFNRLIDLGIEPFLVASATLATVGQRLARRLCSACRRPAPPTAAQIERLARRGVAVDGLSFAVADGCRSCEGRGERGRRGLFEILRVEPELRGLITARTATDRLVETAVSGGLKPLLEVAVEAAARGEISLDEALRVAA